ncbi:MAG: L,D-transpeptidase family protein [Planctomycetota bacterium]
MQTIKTAVVFALLLAVCYGAFVALNAPEPDLPDSFADWQNSDAGLESLDELDLGIDIGSMDDVVSVSPDQLFDTGSATTNSLAGSPSNGTQPGSSPGLSLPEMESSSGLPSVPELPSLSLPSSPGNSPALSLGGNAGSDSIPNEKLVSTPTPSGSSSNGATNEPEMSLEGFPALQLPSGASNQTASDRGMPPTPDLTTEELSKSAANMLQNSANQLQNSLEGAMADAKESVADQSARGLAALGQVSQEALGRMEQQVNSGVGALESEVTGAMNGLAANIGANDAGSLIPTDLIELPGSSSGGTANAASATPPENSTAGNAASEDAFEDNPELKRILVNRTTPSVKFAVAREQALAKAGRGELLEALRLLTPYFDSPELGYRESIDLVDLLDALSAQVIYSDRHLLEAPYTVRAGDTLASVASAFKVNPELLAAVNKLPEGNALVSNSQIKVLQGPFHARVNLQREELTVFLGDLYAGRFPLSLGKDPAPTLGFFQVVDRQQDRMYYGRNNINVKPKDPRNPFGGYWINVSNKVYIHGTAEIISTELKDAGCVSLSPLDAEHVFNILSKGSRVAVVQ